MKTYSLFIIKPGSIKKTTDVMQLLSDNYIRFDFMREEVLSKEQVERHYEEHFGKKFYNTLVDYMTTGNVAGIAKFDPTCVTMIVSSTDPKETEEEFIARSRNVVKEVLRPALAFKRSDFPNLSDEEFKELTMTANGIHASDSPASAEREIGNIFPEYFDEMERE